MFGTIGKMKSNSKKLNTAFISKSFYFLNKIIDVSGESHYFDKHLNKVTVNFSLNSQYIRREKGILNFLKFYLFLSKNKVTAHIIKNTLQDFINLTYPDIFINHCSLSSFTLEIVDKTELHKRNNIEKF